MYEQVLDKVTPEYKDKINLYEVNPDTNKKDGRCTHCGCFMNVKVHYAVAECPIQKWEKDCSNKCGCK